MVNWGLCSALVAGAAATVAPGFPLQGATDLNVTWAENNVSPPGELLPRAGTSADFPISILTPIAHIHIQMRY